MMYHQARYMSISSRDLNGYIQRIHGALDKDTDTSRIYYDIQMIHPKDTWGGAIQEIHLERYIDPANYTISSMKKRYMEQDIDLNDRKPIRITYRRYSNPQ
jgi:hypothetical protein